MILMRDDCNENGIFGTLISDDGVFIASTLEHAYVQPNGTWLPKIPAGSYTCIRGQHQLASMTHPFTTFEITNVPNCTNILIHMGNFDKDSEGCILVGAERVDDMVTNSVITFNKFMACMEGKDSFILTVS